MVFENITFSVALSEDDNRLTGSSAKILIKESVEELEEFELFEFVEFPDVVFVSKNLVLDEPISEKYNK